MIIAAHALLYSDDAAATRAFLKDVLRWPYVSDEGDAPQDWLIFRAGPSEVGVHPTSGEHDGHPWSTEPHHELCLICDDLDATVAELRSRGAEFTGDIQDQGFGLVALLKVPGCQDMTLYQPRHATAYELPATGG